jgi:hypothetical protein
VSPRRDADGSGATRRLAVCASCRRDFVVPVHWEELGETDWWLSLRCGGCETRVDVLADHVEVETFCMELDDVLEGFARGAARLARERTETEIEIFATALALDLISSDDFQS